MGSEFGALNTALTGLFAQRQGLDVTGQNVTNAQTDGYSRQRVDLTSISGPITPAIFATWHGAGAGVTVEGITRLRDAFLEQRGATEHAQLSQVQATAGVLHQIEDLYGEPGTQGIQAQLSAFWNSWDDVSNNPTDLAARQQLLERARTLTGAFNHIGTGLQAQWDAVREQLPATVADINATAANVAKLNSAIQRGTLAGNNVNDLMDQRDKLVMKLAETAGVTVRGSSDGMVDLYLGGGALVRGGQSSDLVVTGTAVFDAVPDPALGGPPAISVVWAKGGYAAGISAGTVGAQLSALNQDIPANRYAIDARAQQLVNMVNPQHAAGFDQNGNPGGPVFNGTTARTISVALSTPDQIAANSAPGALDGKNARTMAELANAPGGVDATYRQLVVSMGVAVQTADQRNGIQQANVAHIDAQREAVAGVNIDEEMTNMLQFQHAYEASSRYMSAVDSMLDTLINRTGSVGR